MSDNEEVYEQFKEVKWMEWCEDIIADEIKTLQRLPKLQTTSAILPKEKVVSKIRNYLQLLGRRIDQIVLDYEDELYKQDRMIVRLWKYVSPFSNLSCERLNQIYSKLNKEQGEEGGVGPSHVNGSISSSFERDGNSNSFPPFSRQGSRQRGLKNEMTHQEPIPEGYYPEGWKRSRRTEAHLGDNNHTNTIDPNSQGILGAGPSNKRLGSERPYWMH